MICVDYGFRQDGTASNLLLPAQIAQKRDTGSVTLRSWPFQLNAAHTLFLRESGRRQANPRPPSLKQHVHARMLKSVDSGSCWERRAAARRNWYKQIGAGVETLTPGDSPGLHELCCSLAPYGFDYIEMIPASRDSSFDYIEIVPASGVPTVEVKAIARRRATERRYGYEYTEMRPATMYPVTHFSSDPSRISDIFGKLIFCRPASNFREVASKEDIIRELVQLPMNFQTTISSISLINLAPAKTSRKSSI
ncbi:hypothetical protein R3P38DRAFT_2767700 [Favolaschia claudopus]|uniref:Uncharacterized protein n=1 Tax=Favolaschia claudopus TaxID=2862362 RepID=A0AAW0CSZ6_9AGAR